MFTWKVIGIIAGLFAMLGALFDALMLKRQKTSLHTKLVSFWDKLDETTIPNIAIFMSRIVLDGGQKYLSGKFFSFRFLFFSIIVSFLFTSFADISGQIIEGSFPNAPLPLPIFTVYFSNYFFDFLTLAITIKALHIVLNSKPIIGIPIIIANIILAITLAVTCLAFNAVVYKFAFNNSFPGMSYMNKQEQNRYKHMLRHELKKDGYSNNAELSISKKTTFLQYLSLAPTVYRDVVNKGRSFHQAYVDITASGFGTSKVYRIRDQRYFRWEEVLLSATSLIPTLLYMGILLVLLISKVFLDVIKNSIMHLMEVITEKDPNKQPKDFIPGTMLGMVLGLTGATIKAVIEIIEVL